MKNEHELKLNEVLKKEQKKIKSNEGVIENQQKEGCNTRTSQEVTHPSTTLAQARLTSEFWWDPVL